MWSPIHLLLCLNINKALITKTMNEVKTTREAIVKAFHKWNTEAVASPDEFDNIDDTVEIAERQAEELLSRLDKE